MSIGDDKGFQHVYFGGVIKSRAGKVLFNWKFTLNFFTLKASRIGSEF